MLSRGARARLTDLGAWSSAETSTRLATKKSRKTNEKTMVVSFNVLELGGSALSHEATWMTFAVIRDHIIGK
eukprot:8636774-Pyramimonas_sp.AAC.1